MAIYVLNEYLQEHAWGIMFFSGIVLLTMGLMFVESFGSLLSVIGFFFGIIFVVLGVFARIGLFSSRLSSLNGLGTVLICLSVVFFSLSFSVIEFQAVAGYNYIPLFSHTGFIGFQVEPILVRPYAWLSLTSIGIGLPLFLAGLIVKAYSARRQENG